MFGNRNNNVVTEDKNEMVINKYRLKKLDPNSQAVLRKINEAFPIRSNTNYAPQLARDQYDLLYTMMEQNMILIRQNAEIISLLKGEK